MIKVMKFGGTSVGSPARIKSVASLVACPQGQINPKNMHIVVLSAMSGTTNALIELCDLAKNNRQEDFNNALNALANRYAAVCAELFDHNTNLAEDIALRIGDMIADIAVLAPVGGKINRKAIVAKGELMSTIMASAYMQSIGMKATLLHAPDFMVKNADGNPDMPLISQRLNAILKNLADTDIVVTQGFICNDSEGRIDNLDRGGSDFTATIIGAAIGADLVEIWTDIDGVHTGDPRVVTGTKRVDSLHYNEAIALAMGGAKILHPMCVYPVRDAGVPLAILDTMHPGVPGTLISAQWSTPVVKAVAVQNVTDHEVEVTVAGNYSGESNGHSIDRVKALLADIPGAHITKCDEVSVKCNIPSHNSAAVLQHINDTLF